MKNKKSKKQGNLLAHVTKLQNTSVQSPGDHGGKKLGYSVDSH